MIWGHLGVTILSFPLPYGRLLFLNDCFIFWQKLTFTGNILITASGALKRQDNTDITPKYHRTLSAERSLCLLNAPAIAHEFASSLEASCPGFFIRLHVCHLHQHSPNVHVQRNSRPSLGLTETLPRNIQGTVVITIIVIAQIMPSHPAPTGQWIIGKQAWFFWPNVKVIPSFHWQLHPVVQSHRAASCGLTAAVSSGALWWPLASSCLLLLFWPWPPQASSCSCRAWKAVSDLLLLLLLLSWLLPGSRILCGVEDLLEDIVTWRLEL